MTPEYEYRNPSGHHKSRCNAAFDHRAFIHADNIRRADKYRENYCDEHEAKALTNGFNERFFWATNNLLYWLVWYEAKMQKKNVSLNKIAIKCGFKDSSGLKAHLVAKTIPWSIRKETAFKSGILDSYTITPEYEVSFAYRYCIAWIYNYVFGNDPNCVEDLIDPIRESEFQFLYMSATHSIESDDSFDYGSYYRKIPEIFRHIKTECTESWYVNTLKKYKVSFLLAITEEPGRCKI